MKGGTPAKSATPDDDDADRAVVYFGEAIHAGYVLIQRAQLANVSTLEPDRWKLAHRELCRRLGAT